VIPLQEQERLRQHFQEQLTGGVKIEHFTQRPMSILLPGREECRLCVQARQVLEELRALSPKLSLRIHELDESRGLADELGVERAPTTILRGQRNRPLRFEGLFGGALFPVIIEMITAASRGETELDARGRRQLQRIRDPISVRLFVTPSSPYAAMMMHITCSLALESARLKVLVTEVEEFPRLAERFQVRAVPLTIINERARILGAISADEWVEELLKASERRTSALLQGLPVVASGPSTPLATAATESRATSGGLILPGR
jgi:glutaredoxin-like protein